MLTTLRSLLARAGELVNRRRIRQDLDDEIRLHLDLEIEHHVANGMSPAEARRTALLAFGGVQRFREETGEARGFAAVESVLRDLRLTLRRLRGSPLFTASVILTLGIGLAAATSIGSLVYGVMLRPLAYPDAERIAKVEIETPGLGDSGTDHAPGTIVFIAERARSFDATANYFENDGVTLGGADEPERVAAGMVAPSLFRILGAKPVLGRTFTDEDALATPSPVIISHAVWQGRFARDPAIIGKSVTLNRGERIIIGVMPPGFDFPSPRTAVWYPDAVSARGLELSGRYLSMIARLRPGVTPQDAQRELESLLPRLRERFPDISEDELRRSGLRPVVRSLQAAMVAPVRTELTVLAIMVAFVLLIAVANVATLLLLRAERLRAETAISQALGASSGRLAQRFIVEGMVLALGGAIVAMPLVCIALSTRFGFSPQDIPRLHEISTGTGTLLSLAGLTATLGLLLGAGVSVQALRRAPARSLRVDTRSSAGPGWRRARTILVSVQIALTLALLCSASLMAESFVRLRATRLGFAPGAATTFEVVLPFRAYNSYQRASAFHLRVQESLRSIPGVRSVAMAVQLPLTPQITPPRLLAVDGGQQAMADINMVSPDYFAVMGQAMQVGRTFANDDLLGAAPAVIVSRSLARELFGEADAVGRTLRFPDARTMPDYRVVGVADDVHGARITDGTSRVLYFPILPGAASRATDGSVGIPYNPAGVRYVVRSDAATGALLPAIRRTVGAVDPQVPIANVTTLDGIVGEATAQARLTTVLLAVAAAAALLLGAVGLYSVIAYAVAGRRNEFAIRLALGAAPSAIMRLVLRDGARISVLGIVMGLGVAAAGVRLIRGMLYETSATDPLAFAGAAATLLAVALLAVSLPARRAGQTDPAGALRES